MAILQKIANIFRLAISTLLVHHFSIFFFSNQRQIQLMQIFASFPIFQTQGQVASDLAKLQKMSKYWPPHEGYFYEFSLAYTISLVLLFRYISLDTVYQSVFQSTKKLGKISKFVFEPLYISSVIFVFMLPMMRLSEMHNFVLFLNFAHIFATSFIVYFFWNSSLKREEEEEKQKTE